VEDLDLPIPSDDDNATGSQLHFFVCGPPEFEQAAEELLIHKMGYDEDTFQIAPTF
jgi:ferredoxin-NADP reductase